VTTAPKVVVACFDKFRLTATANDLCRVVADVAWEQQWDCRSVPMADGGDGTIEVLAALGGRRRTSTVTGPLGNPVEAVWLERGRTAFIEMALASGLALVGGPEGNRPLDASTFGTGQLVAEALASGVKRIVVTLGGSATTDGGLGALTAMSPLARFRGVELVVACDVDTRFVDAARDFGPQKGATPAEVGLLERRLSQLADRYLDERGIDVRPMPGGGAAGGLAGALLSLGASMVSGFDLIADEAGLRDAMERADLVITGEGRCDEESFNGKVVGGVCALARDAGVPVAIVAGDVDPEFTVSEPFRSTVTEVVSLTERFGPAKAWNEPLGSLREVVATLLH
jgi:glycerate 2-kinase